MIYSQWSLLVCMCFRDFEHHIQLNLFLFLRQIPQTISGSDYYEGTGYTKVLLERFLNSLIINQKVETRAKDALLLYLGDEEDVRVCSCLLNHTSFIHISHKSNVFWDLHPCFLHTYLSGLFLQHLSWEWLRCSAWPKQKYYSGACQKSRQAKSFSGKQEKIDFFL